jgi:magnesium-transporting ATPase (P-type)
MSQELTPMQSFQERIQSKVRDDIAAMLPDEVIADMVQKATQSLFFERKKETRRKNNGGWNEMETYELPSFFEDLVSKKIAPIVEHQVAAVITAQMPEINAAIQKGIDAGLMTLAVTFVDAVFKDALKANAWTMESAINSELQRRGMK